MSTGEEILRARIRPPRLPRGAIERSRLSERIQDGAGRRLVLVAAGPGYGKSTAVVQAMRASKWPWAWCGCDPRMRSAGSIAANIVAALQEPVPGFAAAQPLVGDGSEVALMLANEAALTFASDVAIVLDDVHLTLGLPAWDLIEGLVADLPDTAHLVLISRVPLPLALGRMRADGTVLEIDEGELALTREEAAELVRQGGLPVAQGRIDAIRDLTEGWPAGFVLASRRGDLPTTWQGSDHKALFAYLAEEVLGALPVREQEILERIAVPDRLSPPLIQALTDDAEAVAFVRRLAAERFFISRVDSSDEWYRLHHLLLAYLRRRHELRPRDERDFLHRRAASAWEAHGDRAMVVRHLLAADDLNAALDAMEPIAEATALSPDAAELAAWLETVPEVLWRGRPTLILARATLDYGEGRFEASFTAMAAAVRELAARGEHDRAAVALVRLWQNMNAAGTAVRERIRITEPLLAQVQPSASHYGLARLLLATGYGWAGDRARASAEITAVRESSPGTEVDAFAVAATAFYIDFPSGRAEAAERTLEALRSALEAGESPDAGVLAVFVGAFRAIVLNEVGRFEDALSEIDRATRTARRYGFAPSLGRTAAWIRLVALAGLARMDIVEAELVEPPEPQPGAPATHYAYRYLAPAAALAAHRQDRQRLEELAHRVRRAITDQGPEVDQPSILCDIADAAVALGLRELAVETLEEARSLATALDVPGPRARACIMSAALRRDAEGGRLCGEALELTRDAELLSLWTVRCRRFASAALLARLAAEQQVDERVPRVLQACGHEVVEEVVKGARSLPAGVRRQLAETVQAWAADGDAALRALLSDDEPLVRSAARRNMHRDAVPAATLSFKALGGFAVFRNGELVPRAAFGREKARALLASLLCAGRPVHRDELLEWHWPDLPVQRAVRAFHVTMHALRRALGSTRRKAPDGPVQNYGDAYEVGLGPHATFDAREFLALASSATASGTLEALLAAERAFKGPLYPEWPFSEWSAELRRQCERAHVEVLEGVATSLLDETRPREATSRSERLVEMEPEREEWHRLLMRAYHNAGERALALRQFHACRTLLRRELGIEPGPATRELFRDILRGTDPDVEDVAALDGTVTICFTDVVGSTAMAARLGDRQFAEIMDRHAEVVATLAGLHEGHVIKSQGDGFMLVFASVRRAVSFAEELQHRLSAASEADEEEALSVRVGLHTGEAERRGADLLGTAVIHAARLCARADSGQVLVSAVVRDLLEPEGAFSFEAPRLVTLKGLPGRYAASALKIESPDPHRGSRHRAVPARRS